MRRSRILIVDDNKPARLTLMRLLTEENYDTYGASSGEDCIRIAKMHQPDLILMDVKMPGMDGFETGRILKADPELAEIFLVHISAQREPTAWQMQGLESGADGYIAQPVENVELLSRIRAFLRHQNANRALRESERRYRDLYAGNPRPMWIYDCGTYEIIDANAAAERYFEYEKGGLLGKLLPDLLVPEQREAFCVALRDILSDPRHKCWRYRTAHGRMLEIESAEQELVWNGRAARAVLLEDVTTRNRIDRERRTLLERYEREFKSLKIVSEFRTSPVDGQITSNPSGEWFTARFDFYLEGYMQLVERALEEKVYSVEHDVSSELQGFGKELFRLTVSPRDLVELHCASIKKLVPDPNAPGAQGLLECGRLVIIELMGCVLSCYRTALINQKELQKV